MNGAVNEALKDYVIKNYGLNTWDKVKADCNYEEVLFYSTLNYSDRSTGEIIQATHRITGVDLDEILVGFGEFWILHIGMKKYSTLLRSAGSKFEEFLLNLPHFHSRIMLLYPKIIPPEFDVVKTAELQLLLSYYSSKNGLTMFIYGLINGIAKMFNRKINITIITRKKEGAECDQFLINY